MAVSKENVRVLITIEKTLKAELEQQAEEVEIQLKIDKYEGNPDDYLRVYVWSKVAVSDSMSNIIDKYGSRYNYCSTDSLFGHCNNILNDELLFLPVRRTYMFLDAADFAKEGKTISFRTKLEDEHREYSGQIINPAKVDVYAMVESWTSDTYKYFTSSATYSGDYKKYKSAFDNTGTDFDVKDLLNSLSEIVEDEGLGVQAGVQIYSNIDGGLGHFGVRSQVYVSEKYFITPNNE